MTSIRRGSLPTDNFTIISNAWLRDAKLPWAARGLLAWMASHAEGFVITEEVITEAGPSGRDSVRTMIKALEEAGYLKRQRVPVTTGGSTMDYILKDPTSENPNVGKSNSRSDQGKQTESAGQPTVGKSNSPSLKEDQKKNKTPSVSTAKRGTRVPDDFEPDPKMRDWYRRESIGQFVDGRVEHEKFMDYWRAKPGAGGVKLDWSATWRNWMREAADRAQRNGYVRPVSAPPGTAVVPGGVMFHGGPPPRLSTTDQKLAQTMALGRRLQMEEDARNESSGNH